MVSPPKLWLFPDLSCRCSFFNQFWDTPQEYTRAPSVHGALPVQTLFITRRPRPSKGSENWDDPRSELQFGLCQWPLTEQNCNPDPRPLGMSSITIPISPLERNARDRSTSLNTGTGAVCGSRVAGVGQIGEENGAVLPKQELSGWRVWTYMDGSFG